MPNMSRKTIHSVHDSDMGSYVNKQTNTEAYMKSSAYSTSSDAGLYGYKPRVLFNNNYSDEYRYQEKTSWFYSYWSRIRRTVSKVFSLTVFYYVLSVLQYTFDVQTKWFAKLHQLTSKVMLFDTWLLWKTRNNSNKSSKLALLCLLPLLLFGGVHVYLASGVSLAPSCHPNCGRMASQYVNEFATDAYKFFNFSDKFASAAG